MIDCRRLTLPHRCLAPRAGVMIHPLHELVHCGLTEVWLVDELSVASDEPGNVFRSKGLHMIPCCVTRPEHDRLRRTLDT
jgi:hypothetical protein